MRRVKRNPTGGTGKKVNTSSRQAIRRHATHQCATLSPEEGGVWLKDRENTVKFLEARDFKRKVGKAQKKVDFKNLGKVAMQGHYLEGRFCEQTSHEFIDMNCQLVEKYSVRTRKVMKRGKEALRKDPAPVHEIILDLTTGLNSFLNGLAMDNPEVVKKAAEGTARKTYAFLKDMTRSDDGTSSWLPFSASVHPDHSRKFSFHFMVSTVNDDGFSVGRSANGKKGRVGFRKLGPSLLNVIRHSRHTEVDKEMLVLPTELVNKSKRSWSSPPDDLALADFMEEAMIESLKEQGITVDTGYIKAINVEAAEEWNKSMTTESELKKELGRTKWELWKVNDDNKKKQKKLDTLTRGLDTALAENKKKDKTIIQLQQELIRIKKMRKVVENL